jgi:hypothetical protein
MIQHATPSPAKRCTGECSQLIRFIQIYHNPNLNAGAEQNPAKRQNKEDFLRFYPALRKNFGPLAAAWFRFARRPFPCERSKT